MRFHVPKFVEEKDFQRSSLVNFSPCRTLQQKLCRQKIRYINHLKRVL